MSRRPVTPRGRPGRAERAARVVKRHLQRHLTERMGGAGQAGVIGADGDLNMIQHAFGDAVLTERWRTATSLTARFMPSLLWVVDTMRLQKVT